MRVCLISTAHDARDDRLYCKEARSLAKEHDVTLIAPLRYGSKTWDDESIKLVPLNPSLARSSRLRSMAYLLAKLPRGSFDVVHIVDLELIPLLPLLKLRTGAKVVCDIWEANYELLLGPGASPPLLRQVGAAAFRALERRISAWSDLVVTADAEIAQGLRQGVEATVIYNYPHLSVIEGTPEEAQSLKHSLGPGRFLIYHGSMAEERGILEAVQMMALLRERYPDVVLLLVGELPAALGARVREVVAQRGLGAHVRCTGWVEHSRIGAYLAVAEVGLIPFARTRKFEKNIPQKVFEYWAHGLPVVATNLAPSRFFIERSGGGLLTEGNEPRVLAEAVSTLLDDPQRAKELGARGKARVISEWRWEAMEVELLKAYRTLERQR